MTFIINPGAGPFRGRSTLADAYGNLERLLDAAGLSGAPWRRDVEACEDDGRFAFLVTIGKKEVSVLMPGCPFDELADKVSLSTPRVYIDGSSLWYEVATSALRAGEAERSDAEERGASPKGASPKGTRPKGRRS